MKSEAHQPPTTIGSARAASADVPVYEIRVEGHLASRWADWFDGFDLVTEDDGTTAIRGVVADQAALHGLLHRLRDIGVGLVSLAQIDTGDHSAETSPTEPSKSRSSSETSTTTSTTTSSATSSTTHSQTTTGEQP